MSDTTVKRTALVGVIEDLEPDINTLNRGEYPILDNLSRSVNATDSSHGWLIQPMLDRTTVTPLLEGGDGPSADTSARVKRYNQTEIFGEKFFISTTAASVNVAGTLAKEYAEQQALHMVALKEQMERRYSGPAASQADNGSVGRQCAGLEAIIETNYDVAADGDVGGWSTSVFAAPTDSDSSKRDLSAESAFSASYASGELALQGVIQDIYSQGGRATHIIAGPVNKAKISKFSGRGGAQQDASKKMIYAGVDFYDSDFGRLSIVPSTYSRDRTVLVLDFSKIHEAVLNPTKQVELPRAALARKYFMSTERTLVVKNEKALGKIADLTT